MRVLRPLFASALLVCSLTACSVWQNESRKYMEKSSYDYAGIKLVENFVGCAEPAEHASWTEGEANERARTFTRQTADGFELRVEPVDAATTTPVACDYAFADARARASATNAAIADARVRFDAP